MPIIKCQSAIEAYRQRARAKDIHELSGRSGRPDLTRFVSEQILRQLRLDETDVLVDLGCGDGTLLKLVSGTVASSIGLLPTAEEVARVRADVVASSSRIDVRRGLVQRTDLETAMADKIVCNGVILLLVEQEVDAALREIARVSKPGALIFLGEVPTKNEFEGKSYGDSIIRWLWWVLTNEGVSAFVRRLRQVLRALSSDELFIIYPKTCFHEPRDKFVERAKRAGLTLEASFPHLERHDGNRVQESRTRVDYLFRKAATAG
jgi:cyclopropane fatty-acyl-phospholipid synthase-like methyltransferase